MDNSTIMSRWYFIQGWYSPSLKLYYLSICLPLFHWKTMLEEKTVIVDLGESLPRSVWYSGQHITNCLNYLSKGTFIKDVAHLVKGDPILWCQVKRIEVQLKLRFILTKEGGEGGRTDSGWNCMTPFMTGS